MFSFYLLQLILMQLDGRKVALESCILVLPAAVKRILVLPAALKRILVLPTALKRILLLELRRKLLEVVDRALKV